MSFQKSQVLMTLNQLKDQLRGNPILDIDMFQCEDRSYDLMDVLLKIEKIINTKWGKTN